MHAEPRMLVFFLPSTLAAILLPSARETSPLVLSHLGATLPHLPTYPDWLRVHAWKGQCREEEEDSLSALPFPIIRAARLNLIRAGERAKMTKDLLLVVPLYSTYIECGMWRWL